MSKTYTREEVAQHKTEKDCWVIIDGKIYNVTAFLKLHPGGKDTLLQYAGQDVTEQFYALHRHEVLTKYSKLHIGNLPDAKEIHRVPPPGKLSKVPYAESSAFMGFPSPYYNESHHRFRAVLRKFFDEHVTPEIQEVKAPSAELWLKAGKAGLLASRIGPGSHLNGFQLPGDVQPKDFDYFHELIAHEEQIRLGVAPFLDGLGAGLVIGLPPVIHFSTNKELGKKVVGEVLRGEKRICLSISEPFAGSDVANIQTTAKKTADGKFFIVNGIKKWITNGHFCEYFTTAVRTGGPGLNGISLLLIERSEGLTTENMSTSYGGGSGTALITMENVRVPVENLLGKENDGFKCIMANFNHERWLINIQVVRYTRLVVEECFKWAHQRKVFGKALIEQPVIREKLAKMFAQVEACQSWLEALTYQMTKMSYEKQSQLLAGPLALLKLQCTRVEQFVCDEACQIFGGRAITKTGMGQQIERFLRTYKYGAILGGSEEIMADLGVRQAMKFFPKQARL